VARRPWREPDRDQGPRHGDDGFSLRTLPGHPGCHRELVPIERVDAIVDLAPEACRHCARRLHAWHAVGGPRRHQVTEVPAIAAHITEHRCHRRQCPYCGAITLAPLPDEHTNQFGLDSRLPATVSSTSTGRSVALGGCGFSSKNDVENPS
jgi:hypothetical protein